MKKHLFLLLTIGLNESFIATNNYIFICNRGLSSMIAASQVKHDFSQTKVFSLEGGIAEF